MMWIVLDINFEVLVICLDENIQETVRNIEEDNWIEINNRDIHLG